MNLFDLIPYNAKPPRPWDEGDNIPWRDPGFSARMLQEHLSQEHDLASRRFETIDRQVAWIHQHVLGGSPARILDLACGPGLYTSRLARLGHQAIGIDYSPASIGYAAENAELEGLSATYLLDDIRLAEYGTDFDLVMLLYGEFNIFKEDDARIILRKAHSALKTGGHLLIEPYVYAALRRLGREAGGWQANPSGLFCEEPHLLLIENYWDELLHTATRRYYVVRAADGGVTPYAQSFQAYIEGGYEALLDDCGFDEITFHRQLGEEAGGELADLCAVLAVRSPEEVFKGRRRALSYDEEDLIDT